MVCAEREGPHGPRHKVRSMHSDLTRSHTLAAERKNLKKSTSHAHTRSQLKQTLKKRTRLMVCAKRKGPDCPRHKVRSMQSDLTRSHTLAAERKILKKSTSDAPTRLQLEKNIKNKKKFRARAPHTLSHARS